MIRTLLFKILVFFSIVAFSQNDTIEVSKNYKTILIFPDNVSESIIGNDLKFIVDLPKENGSKFSKRILKLAYNEIAKERIDYTNYTVITSDGNSYDFILKLVSKPKKLTWYIKPTNSVINIVNEQKKYVEVQNVEQQPNSESTSPKTSVNTTAKSEKKNVKSTPVTKEQSSLAVAEPQNKNNRNRKVKRGGRKSKRDLTNTLYEEDKEEYMRKTCYYMQYDKSLLKRYFAKKGDLFFWLKGVYYNRNEIYVQLLIQNREKIDLDINFLAYNIATNYKGRTTNQVNPAKPLYIYEEPTKIPGGQERHYVVVFKKFTLDKHKVFTIDMDEKEGNRNMQLTIDHNLINNPKRF